MNMDPGTSNVLSLILSILTSAVTAVFVIGQYKARIDRLIEDQKDLYGKIESIKTEVDKLLEFKVGASKFIDSMIYSSKSPLNLTDVGRALVFESGFSEIFDSVQDDLVEMLEKSNPKTQYDIQEKARELMDSLTDYEPFSPIKDYAFKKGQDMGQILRAGAILLRDYYFKKHPEVVNSKEIW